MSHLRGILRHSTVKTACLAAASLLVISFSLIGCATSRVYTSAQFNEITESDYRIAVYDKKINQLEDDFKNNKIAEQQYKKQLQQLLVLKEKEKHFQKVILENPQDATVQWTAIDLCDSIENAAKTGLIVVGVILLLALKALSGTSGSL